MSELVGNCLVAQSGGPTAVINSSLAGVVSEALNHECIEEIYGARNGVLGILREELVDLAEESQQAIRGLRVTPGAALGSCRYKLKRTQDFDRVLQVFETHNIRYFFYIGGNNSQDSAARISQAAAAKGYDLRVIGVPKTIDNDLALTDHCPGYGSVIKYVSSTVREVACDVASMGQGDFVAILEVMGRNSGWIAAGASLAKRHDHPNDPPHLIYLPETPFSREKFVEDVRRVLSKERYCFVVVGEGLVDADGNYVVTTSSQADSFGNLHLGGTGDYLRGIAENEMGLNARSMRPGNLQRASAFYASATDNDEAFLAGKAAVEAAVQGNTDQMITLLRGDSDHYTCETGLSPLSEVANSVKRLPLEWINDDGVSLNFQFGRYAQPLIQGDVTIPWENGLPKFTTLNNHRVERVLEPYEL